MIISKIKNQLIIEALSLVVMGILKRNNIYYRINSSYNDKVKKFSKVRIFRIKVIYYLDKYL